MSRLVDIAPETQANLFEAPITETFADLIADYEDGDLVAEVEGVQG